MPLQILTMTKKQNKTGQLRIIHAPMIKTTVHKAIKFMIHLNVKTSRF